MLSLRSCLIASALVLTGLTAGCDRKPQPMTLETGRSQDTRPIRGSTHINEKYKGQREPENGPAAPPMRKP